MQTRSSNITRNAHLISRSDRAHRNGHLAGVLWFTGLPGSGKSTLTRALEHRLFELGVQVTVIDNHLVRGGLSADLGFSRTDRAENVRRGAEVSGLLARAGRLVLAGFISPYRTDRDTARRAVGENFHEIFLDADVAVCERRDSARQYERAKAGLIAEFTGVSSPYEKPLSPDLTLDTALLDVGQSIGLLVDYVQRHFAVQDGINSAGRR